LEKFNIFTSESTKKQEKRGKWLAVYQKTMAERQKNEKKYGGSVVFWLGFWFWLGYLGAVLSRFFVSLAVVGTWWDQPPSGVVG
jgi:hypothetical protein